MPSFLVDECIPKAVHEALVAGGYSVVLARNVLQGATDESIVAYARRNRLVVLTEDRRFGFIAIGAGMPGAVVVLLMGGSPPSEKAARLMSVLPDIAGSLSDAVTVIGRTSVRRRPL